MDDLRARIEDALLADDGDAAARLDALLRDDPEIAEHLPELAAQDLSWQGAPMKDLVDHVARVTAKLPTDGLGRSDALKLRWLGFLHDIGKPQTFQRHGREVTFHGHEELGARLARKVLDRLGYPEDFTAEVAELVRLSGRFKQADAFSDSAVRRLVREAGTDLELLLVFFELDVTSRHAHKHERQREQVLRLRDRIAEVAEKDARAAERPDLDGQQVMAYLGLKPGPSVGQALAMLLARRRELGRALQEDEAYAELDEWWRQQQ